MDRHLTVLDAAAAVFWAEHQDRYALVAVDPADFPRQAEHVQAYHRRKAAPTVAAALEALAPLLDGPPGMPGEFFQGQDSSAEAVRDMAGDIKELGA